MYGTIPPFYSLGGGGGYGITGSPSASWTFTKAAETGVSETIATFKVSDNTGAIIFNNATSTDNAFNPRILCTQSAASSALTLTGQGTTDSGALALITFQARIGSGTDVVTRPLFAFNNRNTEVLSLLPINSGANSALSWGSQTTGAPTFTTRSAGTRLVLRNEISGTRVDNAIGANGVGPWYSCPEATSSWAHRWYGGETLIATLRGDGLLDVLKPASVSTLGDSRYLKLSDSAGSLNGRTEIGFGYPGATFQPTVIGAQTTSNTGDTKGNFYIATRDVTTDTAPTVRLEVTSAGLVDVAGSVRATGFPVPSAGVGVHLGYTGGAGYVQVYDYTSGPQYRALYLQGLTIALRPNGTASFTAAATVNTSAVPLVFASYTLATLPAAASFTRGQIWVADMTGGAQFAYSDGTNWRRVSDGTIAS